MQVNIKIDDELYRKLKENAKTHRRTITAQLNILLSSILDTSHSYTNKNTTTTIATNKEDTFAKWEN